MIRLLQIIDDRADFESRRLAVRMDKLPGIRVRTFNWSGRSAASLHVARAVARVEAEFEPDVLHVIGPASLLAAAWVGCRPIVYSPPADAPHTGLRRVQWIGRFRQIQCVVQTGSAALRLAASLPADSVHVIQPPPHSPERDLPLRDLLGITTDQRIVIGIGQSWENSSHDLALWAAVIMHYLDRRYQFVLEGSGPRTERLQRLSESLRLPGFAMFAGQTLGFPVATHELARIADVAVLSCRGPVAPAPVLSCIEAGVPIVAAPSRTATEFVSGDVGVIARRRSARELAQCALEAIDRPRTRREHAGETGDPFAARWTRLLCQIARGNPRPTVEAAVYDEGESVASA